MLIEFTVPMEGPRCDAYPKGRSIRPGMRDDVDQAEGERLIERGMAHRVTDGVADKTVVQPVRLAAPAPAETADAPPPKPVRKAATEKAVKPAGEKAVK